MKGAVMAVAAATVLASTADALHYVKRENPRAIHMPLERSQPSPAKREQMRMRRRNRMAKRAGTISETLTNFEDGSLYFANVTMGTPAQSFRFHIDTGSSDLWANSATSSFCQMSTTALEQMGDIPCSVSGTYDANKSSTYSYVNSDFLITYADTTGAQGDYATDTVRFGNTDVTSQQFGIGYQSNSSEGVMGIGYPNLEVAVQYDRMSAYKNLPQSMASQGLINTPSYSLWLDDLSSSTGNILFGGVDSEKFTGSLTTVPILAENGQYLEMIVGLSGMSISANNQNTTLLTTTVPALLDSGTTLMYLPSNVVEQIYQAVGAQYDSSQGVAAVPCSLGQSQDTIDFVFSGQSISVPMSQIVLDQGAGDTCVFGVSPQDQAPYTLGDTFIRNAYLVYDLDANTISLAQTNFQAGSKTNVQEIQAGASGVPMAEGAASPASAVVAGSASAYNGLPTSLSVFSSNGAAAHPTPPPAPWGAAVAAGAGIMLAAL